MNAQEFRERGYEMVDYIVDYLDSLSQRRVTPNVNFGCLTSALPTSPPETGESVEKIMEDIEKLIMPGLTHWQHPGFHAYYPACSSFPSTIGVMLSNMIGYAGFNWHLTPCGGDLEALMLDWYGTMIGLPDCFLRYGERSRGTGIIFRSTSHCVFISLLTARLKFLTKLSNLNASLSKAALLCSLVAYCTKESRSYLENIAVLCLVNVKIIDATKDDNLVAGKFDKAITEDRKIGLIPFFVYIKIGCGIGDCVKEVGLVCEKHGIWLHVDAAYASNAAICPEYRHILDGVEYASSIESSPSQWMLTSLDCSVLFVKDRFRVVDAVIADRTCRGYSFTEKDWGYPTRTEYQSLKLFFVMQSYGVEGLQKHIRNHVQLAQLFEDYVKKDERFELMRRHFGSTCFRLKGSDAINVLLKNAINDSGKLFVTPTHIDEKYAIRFIICTERAKEEDVKHAWKEICKHANKVLEQRFSTMSQESFSDDLYDEYYRYSVP